MEPASTFLAFNQVCRIPTGTLFGFRAGTCLLTELPVPVQGVEPRSSAYETDALPLSYIGLHRRSARMGARELSGWTLALVVLTDSRRLVAIHWGIDTNFDRYAELVGVEPTSLGVCTPERSAN